MNSTFMGLSIATRGLYSSQAALSVTGTNISNANTDGYSRQTVNQTTAGAAAVYAGQAIIGGGSEVASVERVRDPLLDAKYRRANGQSGEWDVKSAGLTQVEELIGDSQTGFSTVMEDFYAALEALSSDASDGSARTALLEAGNSLCSYLNDTATQLETLRDDFNTSVKTTVEQINTYAKQIAALNAQINRAAASGSTTNDLEDQRDLLIDKLSELTEVTVSQTSSGAGGAALTVRVNGSTLVSGGTARPLECYENSEGMYGIRWQDTGLDFASAGGALQGYLDLRDGSGADSEYQGIPYYLNQLNDFAQTFAKAFNEGIYKDGTTYYSGQAGGYGLDGSTGIRFFTYDDCSTAAFLASGTDNDSRYAQITAANISISQDIQEDVAKIAASSAADEADNNENINDLISLCRDNRMFNKGDPEDFMNSIIATVGTASSYAQRVAENKNTTVKNINDNRTSVSGVSTDEEAANLTKYQQAYNAAAKMVSIWDEIYETTINMVNG